jgi:hypothetical protein
MRGWREGGREGGGRDVGEEGGRGGGREKGEEGGFGLGRWISIQKRPRQNLRGLSLVCEQHPPLPPHPFAKI